MNKEGMIVRVHAQDTAEIYGEFLAQMVGRERRSNWEIARTLEDLLHVPSKVKAMHGKLELSQHVVNEIKRILNLAHDQVLRVQ